MTDPIIHQACDLLRLETPHAKAEAALSMRENWLDHGPDFNSGFQRQKTPPDHPARPPKPELVAPGDVPRRRLGSIEGRGALLHAISHIELNAIDLAADMIARFADHPLIAKEDQSQFIDDWSRVCAEEAKHFNMLSKRMTDLNMSYGDHPAHNGLWEAAHETRHDIAARLAIAPMVLEARGLDVTPGMIKKLTSIGDMQSVAVLQVIYDEEIDHVRIGAKWFQYVSKKQNKDPVYYFHQMVETYFSGRLKPPFNVQARTLAGLTEAYYQPLAKD